MKNGRRKYAGQSSSAGISLRRKSLYLPDYLQGMQGAGGHFGGHFGMQGLQSSIRQQPDSVIAATTTPTSNNDLIVQTS
jgi:hypothetical protein